MSINATPHEFDFVWNAFFDLPDDFDGEVIFRLVFSASPYTTIISSPITVSTVVSPSGVVRYRAPDRTFRVDDFLGEGPIAPWRRGPNDFMTARGVELVASALRMILNTRAANILWGGELAWDPAFGSRFWTLRFSPGDAITDGLALLHAQDAAALEPRIVLKSVFTDFKDYGNRRAMMVHVNFSVITQNVQGNQVVLPEPQEIVVEVS
jgi:hypothetical protein